MLVNHEDQHFDDIMDGRKSWRSYAADFHEQCHWVQHHGTSVGAFLASIRAAQCQLVNEARGVLSGAEKSAIREWRSAGRPLIEVDSSTGQLNESPLDYHENIRYLRILWRDMQQAYCFFDDHNFLYTTHSEVRQSLAAAATFSTMAVGENRSLETAKQLMDEAGNLYLFRGYTDSFHDGETLLTSRLLMEGQCVANEVYNFVIRKRMGGPYDFNGYSDMEDESALFLRVQHGSYGLAFRIFLHYVAEKISGYGLESALRNFIMVCDIALNPPLPPFVVNGRSDPYELSELHPPARFIRLCLTIQMSAELYSKELDTTAMAEFLHATSLSAHLTPTSEYSLMFQDAKPTAAQALATVDTKSLPILRDAASAEKSFTYQLWLQSKFWELRSSAINALLHSDGGIGWEELPHGHVDDPGNDWIRPPALISGGNLLVRSGNPNVAVMQALSVAHVFFAYDAVASPPCFDIAAFPHALSGPIKSIAAEYDYAFA